MSESAAYVGATARQESIATFIVMRARDARVAVERVGPRQRGAVCETMSGQRSKMREELSRTT